MSRLVVGLLPWLPFLAAMIGLAVLQRRRSSSVAFVVNESDRTFKTRLKPGAAWWPAVVAVAYTAAIGSIGRVTWESGTDPEWQVTVIDIFFTIFIGLMALALLGFHLAILWLGLPSVVFTPQEVRLRCHIGFLAVPWDGLRPGHPRQPGPRDRVLHLTTMPSSPTRSRGLAVVPLKLLDIHPWFLADAIRHYAAHPEHRAAIGTPAEHDRLRRHLLAGGAPAQAGLCSP
ncbi:hypothetical protein O7635_07510 [Asanoa sp. WMMD1127]|uniref:hypothetical protein n=1 Tax=Asanoa sp. WMMD1127 TaxID=3016107 RepID=UPI002417C39D|nr:hypothetical protein [Asanoa sp. WMMD1127]MDG4821699.1 hypothetical protein [Asanoa sp. WMMD1127]